MRGWKGTPVESAINENIRAGKPLGGTSAGLAVEGEFVYSAMGDKPDDKNLSSTDVLQNPYCKRVALESDFLESRIWRTCWRIRASSSAIAWGDRWDFWHAL